MKVTGVVGRVDDLGRIVIPKEIRRTLKIHKGGPHVQHLHPKSYLLGQLRISTYGAETKDYANNNSGAGFPAPLLN